MALVDVSQLLLDLDFIDPMKVVNSSYSVSIYGETVTSETATDSWGSIQPASGKAIIRLPEAQRVDNMRSFWFKGEIVASAAGKYTAILVYKGQRFNVLTVFDWLNYGEGWCEGLCVAALEEPT